MLGDYNLQLCKTEIFLIIHYSKMLGDYNTSPLIPFGIPIIHYSKMLGDYNPRYLRCRMTTIAGFVIIVLLVIFTFEP